MMERSGMKVIDVAAGHAMAGMKIPGRWVDVRDPGVLAELEKESAGV